MKALPRERQGLSELSAQDPHKIWGSSRTFPRILVGERIFVPTAIAAFGLFLRYTSAFSAFSRPLFHSVRMTSEEEVLSYSPIQERVPGLDMINPFF